MNVEIGKDTVTMSLQSYLAMKHKADGVGKVEDTEKVEGGEQPMLNTKRHISNPMSTDVRPISLEQEVTDILHKFGMPRSIRGFRFLRFAIMLCVEAPIHINGITKTLYPNIANKFETTPSRVERAIRHAITITWERGNKEEINKLFGYTINTVHGHPTNSECLAIIVDYLKLNGE